MGQLGHRARHGHLHGHRRGRRDQMHRCYDRQQLLAVFPVAPLCVAPQLHETRKARQGVDPEGDLGVASVPDPPKDRDWLAREDPRRPALPCADPQAPWVPGTPQVGNHPAQTQDARRWGQNSAQNSAGNLAASSCHAP